MERFGEGGGARTLAEDGFGVLGQLVHVHDVGQRAEFVKQFQRAVPFHAHFKREEEKNRAADEQNGVERGVNALE